MAENHHLLLKGNNKLLYTGNKDEQIIIKFVDNESNFDGEKKAKFKNKGQYRKGITEAIFSYLQGYNIPTHFSRKISETEISAKKLNMIPIVVVVRNIVAGSLARRFKLKPGMELKYPVIEYYLNLEGLNMPMILESHAYALEYTTPEEMKHIARLVLKINAVLKAFMERRSLKLVDYKLEFGRFHRQIYLADEITPDTCRIWAIDDNQVNQNYFDFSDGKVVESYKEIYNRIVLNKVQA